MTYLITSLLLLCCFCSGNKNNIDHIQWADSMHILYVDHLILTPVAVSCDKFDSLHDICKIKVIKDKDVIKKMTEKLYKLIEIDVKSFDARMRVNFYLKGQLIQCFCTSGNIIFMENKYYEFDAELRQIIFNAIGIKEAP